MATCAVRSALNGWDEDDFRIRASKDGAVLVSLGLDLVGTSAANGGNAASGLINDLRAAGLIVRVPVSSGEDEWRALLRGEDAVVELSVNVSTLELATRLYGPLSGLTDKRRKNRLTAAARWARRRGLAPVDGRSPSVWPRDGVEAALVAPRGKGNHGRK